MMHTTTVVASSWSAAKDRGAKTRERICSFLTLSAGWHYGAGVVISDRVKDMALDVNEMFGAQNAETTEAFPCVGGDILVSGYHGSQTVDVVCRPDGRVDISLEENDVLQKDTSDQDLDDLRIFLKGLMWEPRKSFAYCIQNNSASIVSGSRVQLSSHHRMAAFRSSTGSVPSVKAEESVTTLRATIKALPDVQQLFGILMLTHSPSKAALQTNHLQVGTPAIETFVH